MKKFDLKELETWQKIGIACLLIIVPGMLGWLVEFFFAWYDNGMTNLYWRGGNFLPWINMYSIGAFLILACTYKYRDKPLKVFVISVLACGLFEFLTGFIFDEFFGIRYWNYKNEVLNLNGYICLLSLTGFGIGGLLLIYFLIPLFIKMSTAIPKKVFLTITIALCALILTDEIYNFLITKIFSLPRAIDLYENIRF